jgi:hypothetical protein
MTIGKIRLKELMREIMTRDPDEFKRSQEAIAGSPPTVKYESWLLELMRILDIEEPDNIPDITTYDAHQNSMTPQRYADLIGEPKESEQAKTQRLAKAQDPVSAKTEDDFEAYLWGQGAKPKSV